jgi:hypothetical protein
MGSKPYAIDWPDNTIWLASYPRSGNTYLRSILWNCFGFKTGSVYPDDLHGDLAVSKHTGHFEGAAHGLFSGEFRRAPLIKTHGWPEDGRKAIYIVRNGRDCCLSLWEFLRASGYDIALDDIIAGRHEFGSWSGHLLAWDPAARPNTLFLRFEELTRDFAGTLERLAGFLDLRPYQTEPPKLLATSGAGPHWLSPGKTPSTTMTSAQEALFEQIHGETMLRLGYRVAATSTKPDGGAARADLQFAANCAIIWVCWGEDYALQARDSALTTMGLGIDRVLITDAETARRIEPDGVFTSVVPVEFVYGNNLDKSRLLDLIPDRYDTFLFLDTDTKLIGDVSLGFEKARQHGIAIAPAPHYNLSGFFGFDRNMAQHGVTPADQMQYNSGVIFFHLTEAVRRVLARWRDLCRSAESGRINDQPFLSLAFEQLGFLPYVLSPLYNYRALGELAVGTIRIWHSHYPPPPDINDYETVWPPRRFLEGARVAT